jgi:hypothetical protein
MKLAHLILIAACLAPATPAAGQNKIDLYADAQRASCHVSEDVSPPVVQIHVFLTGPEKARGARFKAPKPDCWLGATWVGDTTLPVHAGFYNSQSDWSLTFFPAATSCGAAFQPPIYIGTINFLVSGQALPCCEMKAMAALQFVYTDCTLDEHPLETGRSVFVNGNASCACDLPLATESTTWGRVKSLYR